MVFTLKKPVSEGKSERFHVGSTEFKVSTRIQAVILIVSGFQGKTFIGAPNSAGITRLIGSNIYISDFWGLAKGTFYFGTVVGQ